MSTVRGGVIPVPLERTMYQEDPMESPIASMTLTVPEAAERLGISRAFAYELVARGEIPFLRLGRRIVIPRRALERMVDAVSFSSEE